MSRLAAVRTSSGQKPVRVLIYGIEGVGKSSFGAKAPKPIFIEPEGGTDNIPGAKSMPGVKTFDDVCESIKELILGKHEFQTLVIDSADWVEKLAHQKIIGESDRSIITANGGYGAGYRESETLHGLLIRDLLSELREKRGMHVVVTAHYQVKTVKDPEAVKDYDAFEIKCHEYVSSLWREWVDCIFFARFNTFLKPEDAKNPKAASGKAKALGDGTRVVYTEKRPAFQAKNRYGLPAEMDFTPEFWDDFMKAAGKGDPESLDQIRKDMAELFPLIKDEGTLKLVMDTVEKAGLDVSKLVPIRNRVREITKGAK